MNPFLGAYGWGWGGVCAVSRAQAREGEGEGGALASGALAPCQHCGGCCLWHRRHLVGTFACPLHESAEGQRGAATGSGRRDSDPAAQTQPGA